MNSHSNPSTNLPLIPYNHPKNKLMSEPSPSSNLNISIPQIATPLQTILPEEEDPHIPLIHPSKPRNRSCEMVRISNLISQDCLYFQHSVRKVRITFESLRILLAHEMRANQRAASLMYKRNLWLNRDKRIIGPIPGINIGDIFFYRIELCIIGLHGQKQAGIDYITATASENGEPVATSVVVSGDYEDDYDNGNELIYTGHGGCDSNVHKHCTSQKLKGGNLALERSMTYGIEIRVIRGIACSSSPTGKVYVYDGLYKVVECMADRGKSGFDVYKFRLVRIKGQEEMGSSEIARAMILRSNPLAVRPNGYISLDISKGKENFPVLLYNDIDELNDPMLFEYVTRPSYEWGLYEKMLSETRRGCACVKGCADKDCYCARLNGGELPYDANGILKRGKPVIYECGRWCRCPPSCGNRVSQGGLRSKFEVFRDSTTGWSVRCLDFIRAGSFLFEINGMVLSKKKAKLLGKEYEQYLVHPNAFPSKWREWGDVSDVFPEYKLHNLPCLPELRFAIDVSRVRNVASYLSHSEVIPNVFVQLVLYDHYNVAFPHLMVFSSENIPPLRELSIDYGIWNAEEIMKPLALTM